MIYAIFPSTSSTPARAAGIHIRAESVASKYGEASAAGASTQAIRNKLLKGREETVFEERWNTQGMRGKYTAIATLRSDNHPIETSVEFVLP